MFPRSRMLNLFRIQLVGNLQATRMQYFLLVPYNNFRGEAPPLFLSGRFPAHDTPCGFDSPVILMIIEGYVFHAHCSRRRPGSVKQSDVDPWATKSHSSLLFLIFPQEIPRSISQRNSAAGKTCPFIDSLPVSLSGTRTPNPHRPTSSH